VPLEDLDGAGKERFIRRRPTIQAAAYQNDDALPDEAADFVVTAQWQTEFREHAVAGLGQIGHGIEQGTVKVEGNRLETHQTLASSARKAPMIEL
jgi:hypothetical protein